MDAARRCTLIAAGQLAVETPLEMGKAKLAVGVQRRDDLAAALPAQGQRPPPNLGGGPETSWRAVNLYSTHTQP